MKVSLILWLYVIMIEILLLLLNLFSAIFYRHWIFCSARNSRLSFYLDSCYDFTPCGRLWLLVLNFEWRKKDRNSHKVPFIKISGRIIKKWRFFLSNWNDKTKNLKNKTRKTPELRDWTLCKIWILCTAYCKYSAALCIFLFSIRILMLISTPRYSMCF